VRINQEFRDVLVYQLLDFGFTESESGRIYTNSGIVIRFLLGCRRDTDTEPKGTRFYTFTIRNLYSTRAGVTLPLSITSETEVRNIAMCEVDRNMAIFSRRDRICKEIQLYCEERHVPVSYHESLPRSRTTIFTLRGWEHVLFRLRFESENHKFYVTMAGDYLLHGNDTNEEESNEFYPWVENGNDVAEWAAKSFDPRIPIQGDKQISTLGAPGQWLHWMFTYGFAKLDTLEVETRRTSNNTVVSELLEEDINNVTLSVITFIERPPTFWPIDRHVSKSVGTGKKKRPELDISNE